MIAGSGETLRVGRKLAEGGQGEVFEVNSPAGVVFKRIFEKKLAEDLTFERRIRVMVANRPAGWREAKSGHVMLTWPTDTVHDAGHFIGFLMPIVDVSQAVELHEIANPSSRHDPEPDTPWTEGFTWRYLVATAENLALAVAILHDSDVVVGDFNERNILVKSDARVTLLDCDSMQISDPNDSGHFLCSVGRPEWTAPELLGADWNTTVRAPSSDLFALAIHIHQLLLEGGHPFDGIWHGNGEKPKRYALARDGLWVHAGDNRLSPRPGAVGIDLVPDEIAALFRRAFVEGATNPRSRPTAETWHVALAKLRNALVVCVVDRNHVYASSVPTCPWCARVRAARAQNPLPAATAPPRTPPVGATQPRAAASFITPTTTPQPRAPQPRTATPTALRPTGTISPARQGPSTTPPAAARSAARLRAWASAQRGANLVRRSHPSRLLGVFVGLVILAPSYSAVSRWLDRQSEPVWQATLLIPRVSRGLPWRGFHQSVLSLANGGGKAETVAAFVCLATILFPIWRWFVVGTNTAMFLGMVAVVGPAAGYPDRPPTPAFIGAGVLAFFALVAVIVAVSTYGPHDLPLTAALLAIPIGVFFWWLLCCGVALVLAIALWIAGKSPDDNLALYAVGYGLAALAVIVAGVRSLFS